jgi:hypothetical protein
MKRLLAVLSLVALASSGAFLAPPTASADVVGAAGAFTLHGSNGFRIAVLAYSRRADGRGEVLIFVGRRHAGVSYFAPANVTDGHIEADLGGLGTIAAQFVPNGHIEKEESPCEDEPTQFEAGAYQGTIKFRGEEAYTEASATRVRAEIKPFLAFGCFGSGEGETIGRGLPGAGLKVRSAAHNLVLQVNKNRPGAKVLYQAEMHERRGKIAITRSVGGVARSGAFVFSMTLPQRRCLLPRPSPALPRSTVTRRRQAVGRVRSPSTSPVTRTSASPVPVCGPGLFLRAIQLKQPVTEEGGGLAASSP